VKYFNDLLVLTNEMSVYILFGFLIAGILHVTIKKDRIKKWLGKKNFKSVLYASLLGVPLPLCSCGVIPTGISFYREGASRGATVSFLISTPQTGVDSIMVTYSMMGLPFTIARPLIAFITGIGGGILANFTDKGEKKTVDEIDCACDVSDQKENKKRKNIFTEIFRYAFIDFFRDIAKWLLIGLLAAALISVLVPDDFFTNFIGNDLLSMIIILLVSVPLYVCATGSVPIAAVLIAKGLSPGAALVFLMAGPATNIATITVIGKTLGRKTLFVYLFSIMAGAIISGLIIDYAFPKGFFTEAMMPMHHAHHEHQIIPYWLQLSSTIVFSLLIAFALLRKYLPKRKTKKDMNSRIIKIGGMTCNHCRMNVEKILLGVKDIRDVRIDLSNGEAVLTGENIDMINVAKKIEEGGYEFIGEV